MTGFEPTPPHIVVGRVGSDWIIYLFLFTAFWTAHNHGVLAFSPLEADAARPKLAGGYFWLATVNSIEKKRDSSKSVRGSSSPPPESITWVLPALLKCLIHDIVSILFVVIAFSKFGINRVWVRIIFLVTWTWPLRLRNSSRVLGPTVLLRFSPLILHTQTGCGVIDETPPPLIASSYGFHQSRVIACW